jgi:hypothetical protein
MLMAMHSNLWQNISSTEEILFRHKVCRHKVCRHCLQTAIHMTPGIPLLTPGAMKRHDSF